MGFSLRGLAFFMMSLAIVAALVLPGKEESRPVSHSELQEKAERTFFIFFMYQLLAVEQAPAQEREALKGQLQTALRAQSFTGAAASAERFVLLRELGQEADIEGSSPYVSLKNLYDHGTLLPVKDISFSLAVEPLIRRKQLQHSGDAGALRSLEEELQRKATRFMAVITILSGSFFLACGLAFFIIIWARRSLSMRFLPVARSMIAGERQAALESVLIFFFFMFPLGRVLALMAEDGERLPLSLAISLAGALMAFLHFREHTSGTFRFFADVPLSAGLFLREVSAGILGFLAIVPPGLILLFFTLLASGKQGVDTGGAHPIAFELGERFWLSFTLAVVVAPLVEELVFRTWIHSLLAGVMRLRWALILGGLFFASLHPQTILAWSYLAFLGAGLALVREYSRTLLAPVITHALANGMALGIYLVVTSLE
ncbi:MAG: CPBP family intramembrane metalloprotease [Spirochaetales bacterium]|nr:CPBP family intramembrane metalloprotease [Spirochaetales bacterium]